MGREEDPNFELFFHFRWDRGWLSMKMLRLGKGSDFVVICAAFCHRKCMLFGEIHSVWCVPSTLTWRKNLKLSKNDFMHKIVYIIYIYIYICANSRSYTHTLTKSTTSWPDSPINGSLSFSTSNKDFHKDEPPDQQDLCSTRVVFASPQSTGFYVRKVRFHRFHLLHFEVCQI